MANPPIQVPYNRDLKNFEELLSTVRRPGDFFASGSMVIPVPRIAVNSLGRLSFPVTAEQVHGLVQRGSQAPYGLGTETIVDTSVRKVWQLGPEEIQLDGTVWESALGEILERVKHGLGCAGLEVGAELYKLLVYEAGCFFKPHRDTEKAPGMFATLVIVLPCEHSGGELVIEHAGRRTEVDLSGSEPSEIKFVAFYADCRHEVKPVIRGSRVCLVFNLIHRNRGGGKTANLVAPDYRNVASAAAKFLQASFSPLREAAPKKLVWLLEHQYSAAELSFSGLKNADLALAGVLKQAAVEANLAIHLGLIHIREYGPAEFWEGNSYRRGWGRSRYETHKTANYQIVEVSDSSSFINEWRDPEDDSRDLGDIPIKDGEVLPCGALDGEPPDDQRVMEATGNEGASFERAYHRAALVLWPNDRFGMILLQSSIKAALAYLDNETEKWAAAKETHGSMFNLLLLAREIVERWETGSPRWRDKTRDADPAMMIRLLGRLEAADLLDRFIVDAVSPGYDGATNKALVETAPLLGPEKAAEVLAKVVSVKSENFLAERIDLIDRLWTKRGKTDSGWHAACIQLANALVQSLEQIQPAVYSGYAPSGENMERGLHPSTVVGLFALCGKLRQPDLEMRAVSAMVNAPKIFDPYRLMVESLHLLKREGFSGGSDAKGFQILWENSVQALLARSEYPPRPPKDWAQEFKTNCRCKDCAAIKAFASSPSEKIYRFKAVQNRRQHLEGQIMTAGVDMVCVTERKGSPLTLVCEKTFQSYQDKRELHAADAKAMNVLLSAAKPPELTALQSAMFKRLQEASSRVSEIPAI